MASEPPPPPPDLPAYVRDGLGARTPDELRAIAAWAEELADHKERTLERELERPPNEEGAVASTDRYTVDGLSDEVGDVDLDLHDATGAVYLYWIETYCNKDNCSNCPHGPYPYVKYRVGDTVRTRYGKKIADSLGVQPPE